MMMQAGSHCWCWTKTCIPCGETIDRQCCNSLIMRGEERESGGLEWSSVLTIILAMQIRCDAKAYETKEIHTKKGRETKRNAKHKHQHSLTTATVLFPQSNTNNQNKLYPSKFVGMMWFSGYVEISISHCFALLFPNSFSHMTFPFSFKCSTLENMLHALQTKMLLNSKWLMIKNRDSGRSFLPYCDRHPSVVDYRKNLAWGLLFIGC